MNNEKENLVCLPTHLSMFGKCAQKG